MRSSLKRRQIDDFIQGGPGQEYTKQQLNQLVSKNEPLPIYQDLERQRLPASEENPTKVYNNYTHFRVWNRGQHSSRAAKPIDDVVRRETKMVHYQNNNTPWQKEQTYKTADNQIGMYGPLGKTQVPRNTLSPGQQDMPHAPQVKLSMPDQYQTIPFGVGGNNLYSPQPSGHMARSPMQNPLAQTQAHQVQPQDFQDSFGRDIGGMREEVNSRNEATQAGGDSLQRAMSPQGHHPQELQHSQSNPNYDQFQNTIARLNVSPGQYT